MRCRTGQSTGEVDPRDEMSGKCSHYLEISLVEILF